MHGQGAKVLCCFCLALVTALTVSVSGCSASERPSTSDNAADPAPGATVGTSSAQSPRPGSPEVRLGRSAVGETWTQLLLMEGESGNSASPTELPSPGEPVVYGYVNLVDGENAPSVEDLKGFFSRFQRLLIDKENAEADPLLMGAFGKDLTGARHVLVYGTADHPAVGGLPISNVDRDSVEALLIVAMERGPVN
jgi:hypothetical protein